MKEALVKNRIWEAYELSVELKWSHPEIEEILDRIVLPDWNLSPKDKADFVFSIFKTESGFRYEEDGVERGQFKDKKSLAHALKSKVHLSLATEAPHLVFVHAGVVLTEYGLIVIPGKSYSGKSSLVLELVRAGCRFYSDEYAIVDEKGRIRPFPRQHCRRLPQGEQEFTAASELGWGPDLEPIQPKVILLTRFQADAEWRPKPLSSGEAVLKMLENTVCARPEPEKSIRHLSACVQESKAFESQRGEAGVTAQDILDWMGSL